MIGKDSALWAKVHDVHGAASTSAGWFNLGGVCMSAPVVCSWGPKNVSVFVIGTDRQAWCCMWDGTKWTWTCVAGQKLNDNSLAVASWGPGRLDLFGIGTDTGLKHTVRWRFLTFMLQADVLSRLITPGSGLPGRIKVVHGLVDQKRWPQSQVVSISLPKAVTANFGTMAGKANGFRCTWCEWISPFRCVTRNYQD